MTKNKNSNEYLVICQEQIKGKGEDFFLFEVDQNRLIMGVFDGCGGSGAKIYPAFDGRTGAKVASRALAGAVKLWFQEYMQKNRSEETLKMITDKMLKTCKERGSSGSALLGSLNREFPSTIVFFTAVGEENRVDFYWCGDSRGYILDQDGLHQATVDDVTITDAMKNLREDAPMTNVASASRPYEIHRKQVPLSKPAAVLTATDGCFGYLPSPVEFERLLLETLKEAEDMKTWKELLKEQIFNVSGDDFSMTLWTGSYSDFQTMKESLLGRLDHLNKVYPPAGNLTEEELFLQWEKYRNSYENLWTEGED